ncbi:hypothetical protein SAMN06265371_110135 [Lutibacter agarilyticus]|uniref:Curlin associated repeat-containing protein n=1 Tax=Lutibacter agarilyticus TaxID=1109740 RepID=A0A238YRK6_9FLAO|nr:hypothetical protein [Lutibacter agarilyticus]SNR73916.1 hypothetical protein SAMN06265371_110135 [Lutibacter agarilyticus]
MKRAQNILFFLVLLLCLFSFNSSAQKLTDENTYLINQYFKSSIESTSVSHNFNKSDFNNELQANVVSLNQIGNSNEIDIKSKPNNSQQVIQKGNQNYYNFINYYNSNPSNFNIIQQGEANSLQIYGQNSIIENISIIQNSSFKTMIIKNY